MNRISGFGLGIALTVVLLAAAPAQQVVNVTLHAAPGTISPEPGMTSNAWLYNGQSPGPLIRATVGDLLRIRVINDLPDPTTVHWHGLPVPLGVDGVPGISRPPIMPGQEFTYEFVAPMPGTYFYHPHVGLQLDRGLFGMMIIDPVSGGVPYDREILLVLDDLLNGPPIPGQPPYYPFHLINGKTSSGTSPLMINQGETVRLRILNAGTAENYAVAVGGHTMTVIRTDGQPCQPLQVDALGIAPGERYDALITANNPGTWSIAVSSLFNRNIVRSRAIMKYSGSTVPDPSPSFVPQNLSSGLMLDYAMLSSPIAVDPITPTPDRSYPVVLSGGPGYNFFINGEAWPNVTPFAVAEGEEVQMNMTAMGGGIHPMHIHGHFFRLMGTAGGTTHPPIKDTVMVWPGMMNTVQVQFLADNPGRWMFHCHQLYHAERGMMNVVSYVGDADVDGVPDAVDYDPGLAYPALTTNPLGNGFAPGTTMAVEAQWPSGESVDFYAGTPLSAQNQIDWLDLGILKIWPVVPLGSAVSVGGTASLPLVIPNDPSLFGSQVTLQAIATHPTLAPNLRLSSTVGFTL